MPRPPCHGAQSTHRICVAESALWPCCSLGTVGLRQSVSSPKPCVAVWQATAAHNLQRGEDVEASAQPAWAGVPSCLAAQFRRAMVTLGDLAVYASLSHRSRRVSQIPTTIGKHYLQKSQLEHRGGDRRELREVEVERL